MSELAAIHAGYVWVDMVSPGTAETDLRTATGSAACMALEDVP